MTTHPKRDAEAREPWDLQPGETTKAYSAFCVYRDLDPNERSVLEAYRQGTGRTEARWPAGAWTGWCSRWRWVERVAEWDTMRARETTREELARLRDERRAAAKTRVQIGKLALAKGMEALQALDMRKVSVAEAARLLEVAHRLQRESYPEALPAEPAPTGDLSVMEELRQLLLGRARDGDMEAIEALVRVEERIAKAEGTDAPERHLHGFEATLAEFAGGRSPAGLSVETRRRIVAELEAGDDEAIEGELADG